MCSKPNYNLNRDNKMRNEFEDYLPYLKSTPIFHGIEQN